MSIVADAADGADGADGVMQLVLADGRYPNCPRSEPPLAVEDNLNPKRAQEGLCPPQPASECAGALWPARPFQPMELPAALVPANKGRMRLRSIAFGRP
jgi:hypothetical protein